MMDQEQGPRHSRIGEILKELGYVTDQELKEALAYQRTHKGMRLGKAMMELELISEEQMLKALGMRLGLKLEDPSRLQVDLEAVARLPERSAQQYQVLPVRAEEGVLTVLINDPLDLYSLEDIRQTTGMDLELRLCRAEPLEQKIRYYYAEIRARRAAGEANAFRRQPGEGTAPVVRLLDDLLQRARRNDASDIHIEPFADEVTVRMRIDGVMADFVTLKKELHQPLIARLKVLGKMDIAEHRLPQDGHFRVTVDGEIVNTRVSVMPAVHGEKAVIRLLSAGDRIDHKDTFGMSSRDYGLLKRMLKAPNGLIYLTGPTGSGKTTTLYMVLDELAKGPVNICTIEDPVEQELPKISQSQVNGQIGLTFETGLRALLRQDPDIIMVGETRDEETAAVSVRAAITGHLVLSTLHTNDAVSSIIRLEDMGIAPYLASASLVGIVAQRLVRKLCPRCARLAEATQEDQRLIGKKVEKVWVPTGCPACGGTGYRGRTAIHEILTIDRQIRQMIADRAPQEAILTYAVKEQQMRTLKGCGAELVEQGTTSVDELRKAVYHDAWEMEEP